jgi:methionyl aminopeptidase
MIILKTDTEIENLRQSNILLGKVHGEIAKHIKPGIKTIVLDKIAEEYIRDNGAKPAFLKYNGYPYTLCISVNDVVVHGFPSNYEIKEGDIVSIDCGTVLNGFVGDSAFTYAVGDVNNNVWSLLQTTLESLYKAISVANDGNRIGDIGFSVQYHAESNGFSVVRDMTGHGIGRKLHEEPVVPNYGRRGTGKKLKSGMTIAIEPMINMGKPEITIDRDGWTTRTADGSLSAHYELSVAIKNNKVDILSTFEYIYEALAENKNISAPKL